MQKKQNNYMKFIYITYAEKKQKLITKLSIRCTNFLEGKIKKEKKICWTPCHYLSVGWIFFFLMRTWAGLMLLKAHKDPFFFALQAGVSGIKLELHSSAVFYPS